MFLDVRKMFLIYFKLQSFGRILILREYKRI